MPLRFTTWRTSLGAACIAAMLATTAAAAPPSSPPQDREAEIQRGKYLVHEVARCVQCHTPRDEKGNLLETQLLQGAVIPLASPFRGGETWAFRSVPLAGLPGWSDEDIVTLLTTGRRTDGRPPRPPMQQFHLHPDDARAVVAYLRSLTP